MSVWVALLSALFSFSLFIIYDVADDIMEIRGYEGVRAIQVKIVIALFLFVVVVLWIRKWVKDQIAQT